MDYQAPHINCKLRSSVINQKQPVKDLVTNIKVGNEVRQIDIRMAQYKKKSMCSDSSSFSMSVNVNMNGEEEGHGPIIKRPEIKKAPF